MNLRSKLDHISKETMIDGGVLNASRALAPSNNLTYLTASARKSCT
jgi:hypothetical protein